MTFQDQADGCTTENEIRTGSKRNIVGQKTFLYKGVQADEVRLTNGNGTVKLAWALHPLEKPFVNNTPNQIVHCDFDPKAEAGSETSEEAARRKIGKAFSDLHSLDAAPDNRPTESRP